MPHIAEVIRDVRDDEGVEITINCNIDSFTWIIDYLNASDPSSLLEKINIDNCLNLIVSSLFLGLEALYS